MPLSGGGRGDSHVTVRHDQDVAAPTGHEQEGWHGQEEQTYRLHLTVRFPLVETSLYTVLLLTNLRRG